MQIQDFLNADQVAVKLGISRSMVYRLQQAGKIPSGFKLGRLRRWSEASINEWLQATEQPEDEPGDSKPEVKAKIKEEVKAKRQGRAENKMPSLPKEEREKRSMRVDAYIRPSVYYILKKKVVNRGYSLNGLINELLDVYLEQLGVKA